jgi:protein O-GlcNAc transferase
VPLPPPCLENGYVTFGSFNNHSKIGDEVIATWAQVLLAIPRSKLILRSSVHFGNPTTQRFFRERFVAHGVEANRLEFQEMRATRSDHLAGMREADIVLDPFPCNGGTTSCEALWMGLPLVTMEIGTYMGRQGSSYLEKLGLTDLIATNTNDYVEIARRLSEDKSRLNTLRTTLRPRVTTTMFNYSLHTLELETAFGHMQSHLEFGEVPVPFAVKDQNIL